MKCGHFLCGTENLVLGAMLVDKLLGVRGLEKRGRCLILYLFCMDSFINSYIFLCFFFSPAAFLHASLHSAERGDVAIV